MAEEAGPLRLDIVNRKGLHARPAAKLRRLVLASPARAIICHDGFCADGTSIMELLLLAAPCGSVIEVEARGPEADALLDGIRDLVASGFGEGPSTGEDD